jgi:hypothetical protein
MPMFIAILAAPAIWLTSLWARRYSALVLLIPVMAISCIFLTSQHITLPASSPVSSAACLERAGSFVGKPRFLDGIIPDVVDTFVVLNVDGANGGLKLVAWCQPIDPTRHLADDRFDSQSGVELISVKAGQKATSICHAFGDGLYNPRILAIRDCKYQGHQVFLLLRNDGAAVEVAEPFWIDNHCLRALPPIGAERFEIRELNGPKSTRQQHLIGYSRIVGSSEMPCIYDWSDEQFVVNNDSHPDYYDAFANENKRLFTDKDAGPCDLYGEAVFLKRAGRETEALKVLYRIRKDVERSDIPELIYGSADLLDRLGQRKDSLAQSLDLYRLLEKRKHAANPYNPAKRNYLNYVSPELAYECSVLLDRFGKKKEALCLLKDVHIDVDQEPDLVPKYRRLVARLQKG